MQRQTKTNNYMIEVKYLVVFWKRSGKQAIPVCKQFECTTGDALTWILKNERTIKKTSLEVFDMFSDAARVQVIEVKML